MLHACNYLNVPALFELCCASVASTFKGEDFNKMKKELITVGDSENDDIKKLQDSIKYSEEDNEQLMRKYPWVLKDMLDMDSQDEG